MRRLLLLNLVGLIFLTGCPHLFHRTRVTTPARIAPRAPSLPRSRQPERTASNDILIKGTHELSQKNFSKAVELFQESINLDPSNGAAYYYLALAKSMAKEEEEVDPGEILDLLDRAETLLEGDEAWLKAIERFREEMLDGNG